jgi:hypothetical protein
MNQRALPEWADHGRVVFSRRTPTARTGDSSLKASEFAVWIARVRGNAANILSLQYRAVNSKKERTLTCGQSLISATIAADQAFISSEIASSVGRGFAFFTDWFLLPHAERIFYFGLPGTGCVTGGCCVVTRSTRMIFFT